MVCRVDIYIMLLLQHIYYVNSITQFALKIRFK